MNIDMSAIEEPRKTYAWERHLGRFWNSGHSSVEEVVRIHSEICDQDPAKKRSLAPHLMVSVAPRHEVSRFVLSLGYALCG